MNRKYTTIEYKNKKEEARNLRKTTDLTLKQIAEKLDINHITSCLWCKNISPEKNVVKNFNPSQRIGQKFNKLTIIDYTQDTVRVSGEQQYKTSYFYKITMPDNKTRYIEEENLKLVE